MNFDRGVIFSVFADFSAQLALFFLIGYALDGNRAPPLVQPALKLGEPAAGAEASADDATPAVQIELDDQRLAIDGQLLAIDDNGDGDIADPSDVLAPGGDTTGDGVPDTGPLAPPGRTSLVARVTLRPASPTATSW